MPKRSLKDKKLVEFNDEMWDKIQIRNCLKCDAFLDLDSSITHAHFFYDQTGVFFKGESSDIMVYHCAKCGDFYHDYAYFLCFNVIIPLQDRPELIIVGESIALPYYGVTLPSGFPKMFFDNNCDDSEYPNAVNNVVASIVLQQTGLVIKNSEYFHNENQLYSVGNTPFITNHYFFRTDPIPDFIKNCAKDIRFKCFKSFELKYDEEGKLQNPQDTLCLPHFKNALEEYWLYYI